MRRKKKTVKNITRDEKKKEPTRNKETHRRFPYLNEKRRSAEKCNGERLR